MTEKPFWKKRRVVAALVVLGLSLGGGSIALSPVVTEALCAVVGCQ